ncbi:MAG: class I SAM-dependent RNA methyltransferase [Puniceicoccales bacterium]|jgi:23S rRNA (uracil1939-C5)-methyltransferase/tRNA (uracil-5-)-methyltransferase|nr:class I SAM-dependent RNA methyltransferase [Puniceicoccales bacterium]
MDSRPPKNFIPKPFAYHEEMELRISTITNLGLGLGRVNNWVVMVPFVCVGELVKVRVFRNHKNFSEADLITVLEPSDKRVEPTCALFGKCGGCQYQHIAYPAQLCMKRAHVREAMLRLGGVNGEVSECIHSEHIYGYRSKITPHFQKFKKDKNFPIGFLANSCNSKLVDVECCSIATKNINGELGVVRERTKVLAKTFKRGGTLLLREGNEGITTDSNAIVAQNIGKFVFRFKGGSFFQNNSYVLPKMVKFVTEVSRGCDYLVDAYCGVGVFAICGAEYFCDVRGVEIDQEAIFFARKNAEINGVANISFTPGDAAKIFAQISFQGDRTCVIIDPPRSGCSDDFIEQILTFAPRKIVYVSCAPDTQARDIKSLITKYEVRQLQPIDMFPQTRHIENIAVLEKREHS